MRWRRRRPPPPPVAREPEIILSLPCVNPTYEGEPPFQVQWLHESRSPAMVELRTCASLGEAVEVFFEIGWPQRPGWAGSIIDGRRRRVLQWNSTTEMLHAFGPTGGWWGTEIVFGLMDALDVGTMVDRAIWETMSREMTW